MKIIGETKDGFILEASKDDVAAMEGLYSHQKKYEVGDLIDINGLFSRYANINNALNNINRLKNFAEDIIKATSWVEEFRKG